MPKLAALLIDEDEASPGVIMAADEVRKSDHVPVS
jgi:hypothetical protein